MSENYSNYDKHLKRTLINKKVNYGLYENYYKKNILRFFKKDKKIKIVDLGCGFGQVLYFLRKQNYCNVLGVDLSNENIIHCQKEGFNVVCSDILNYLKDLKDKKDVFILSNVVEHFNYSEIENILNLIYKKLEKNGKLIIIIPNCNNVYGLATYFSDITHKSPLNEKSFEDIIVKTPFKTYEFCNLIVYPNVYFLDSLIWLYNKILFIKRRINNLLNGQKPFKVQSKNLLVILNRDE